MPQGGASETASLDLVSIEASIEFIDELIPDAR
jgi:hypothetical protein